MHGGTDRTIGATRSCGAHAVRWVAMRKPLSPALSAVARRPISQLQSVKCFALRCARDPRASRRHPGRVRLLLGHAAPVSSLVRPCCASDVPDGLPSAVSSAPGRPTDHNIIQREWRREVRHCAKSDAPTICTRPTQGGIVRGRPITHSDPATNADGVSIIDSPTSGTSAPGELTRRSRSRGRAGRRCWRDDATYVVLNGPADHQLDSGRHFVHLLPRQRCVDISPNGFTRERELLGALSQRGK